MHKQLGHNLNITQKTFTQGLLMLQVVLRASYIVILLVLTTSLQSRYSYCLYFKKREAQRG